jgi:hypothetical protein
MQLNQEAAQEASSNLNPSQNMLKSAGKPTDQLS